MKVTKFLWSVRTRIGSGFPLVYFFPFVECLDYHQRFFIVYVIVAFGVQHFLGSVGHWSPFSVLALL